MRAFPLMVLALCAVASSSATARTALSPAPTRDSAHLEVDYNGTLLNEVRTVGLLKGSNTVAFSFKGVAIDVRSLRISVVDGGDDVRVIGFTMPPGESNAVLADVYANRERVATFRVSYLLGGVTRDMSYSSVLETSGDSWRITREATVFNRSGERFDDVKVAIGSGMSYAGTLGMPEGRKVTAQTPKALAVKRIYRVPLVPMPMVGGAPEPLTPELFYVLDNDTALNPGKLPLMAGKLRMFQLDRAGTQAFVGEDLLPVVSHGEHAEVRGGGAPDLRVKWFLQVDEDRNPTKARRSAREPDTYNVRVDRFRRYRVEVKNFKKETASVWAVIPVNWSTGVKVLKSTHPTDVERSHTDGITVKINAKGGGAETVASVDIVYPDYVFVTY